MKSKLSLSNKIGAILLTIVVAPSLLISLFTIPFEFVVLNLLVIIRYLRMINTKMNSRVLFQ